MKLRKKSILKFLKRECDKLPKKTYKAYHKYFKPQFEMIEGQSGLVGGYIQEHPVNHKRRAFRLWKRHGWEGIVYYFASQGYKIAKT